MEWHLVTEWGKNPTKILGSSISVKYLGFQGFGGCQDIPSKVMAKLLHLAPPTTKKEAQHVVGLLRFWRQRIPHWVFYSNLFTEWPENWLALNEVQDKRSLCTRSRLLCKLLCHVSQRIQQMQRCLKHQCRQGMMFGAFDKPP